MIELKKLVVFLVVTLLFIYMVWINFNVLKKYGNSKTLSIFMVIGLGLITSGTFFDVIASLIQIRLKPLISLCFTGGAIVFATYIVLWSNHIIRILANLNKSANIDEMTGLYNRVGFEGLLKKSIEGVDESFYIMVLDLDKTKEINDNFGHLNGDKYIINAANIIHDEIGSNGFAARTGGDEFVAFIKNMSEYEIQKVKRCIKERVANIFIEQNTQISVGYSKYKEDGKNFKELLMAADERMYEDKKKRNGIIRSIKFNLVDNRQWTSDN